MRLKRIIESWPQILEIIEQELPSVEELEKLLECIGCPKTLAEIGQDEQLLKQTFETTKDIRDKYVLSRLIWDLGIIDEVL